MQYDMHRRVMLTLVYNDKYKYFPLLSFTFVTEHLCKIMYADAPLICRIKNVKLLFYSRLRSAFLPLKSLK